MKITLSVRATAVSVACVLMLGGCATGGSVAPLNENITDVEGPPISDVVTQFDRAISCLDGKIHPGITFSVGSVLDATGKEQLSDGGTGKFITQGAGDIVQSALFQAGATVLNRRDPRVMEAEARWGVRDTKAQLPSVFFVTGSINSLDFIPGGGFEAQIGGVGPRYRQYRIVVGLDMSITETSTGRIVANVPLQKQIVATDAGFGVGRFFGNTLVSLDMGSQRREAVSFALRQMLGLATFDLLTQVLKPEAYTQCSALIDGVQGVANTGRTTRRRLITLPSPGEALPGTKLAAASKPAADKPASAAGVAPADASAKPPATPAVAAASPTPLQTPSPTPSQTLAPGPVAAAPEAARISVDLPASPAPSRAAQIQIIGGAAQTPAVQGPDTPVSEPSAMQDKPAPAAAVVPPSKNGLATESVAPAASFVVVVEPPPNVLPKVVQAPAAALAPLLVPSAVAVAAPAPAPATVAAVAPAPLAVVAPAPVVVVAPEPAPVVAPGPVAAPAPVAAVAPEPVVVVAPEPAPVVALAPVATPAPAPELLPVAVPAPTSSPAPQATEPVTMAAAAPVAQEPASCTYPTGPFLKLRPAAGFKSTDYLYVESDTPSFVCVADAKGVFWRHLFKSGGDKSFVGSPPWRVQSADLANMQVFFQGAKLPRVLPGVNAVLVEKAITIR